MLAKSWLKTGKRHYTRGPQTLWDRIVRAPIMHHPGPVLRSLFTDAQPGFHALLAQGSEPACTLFLAPGRSALHSTLPGRAA